jgi:hypothetical protein
LPRHASNSERIAKMAAEAEAKAKEKAAKPAKPKRARAPRAPKAPPRFKYVWTVGPAGGSAVATFPYNQRAEADAEAARVGKGCVVTQTRVQMEPEPIV